MSLHSVNMMNQKVPEELKKLLPSEISMLKHIVSSDLLFRIFTSDKFDMSLLDPDRFNDFQSLILSDSYICDEFKRVLRGALTSAVSENFDTYFNKWCYKK